MPYINVDANAFERAVKRINRPLPSTFEVGQVHRSAVLSEESPRPLYRYTLERRWGPGPAMLFVLLNPSDADAERDDPTVRRCMAFARTNRFDAVVVANPFAYRTPSPNALLAAVRARKLWEVKVRHSAACGTGVDVAEPPDPVGPLNDDALRYVLSTTAGTGSLVLGWGTNAALYPKRVGEVLAIIREVRGDRMSEGPYALELTQDGHPKHPLYIRKDAIPMPYDAVGAKWFPHPEAE